MKLWMALLFLLNLIGPLFFLHEESARLVLVTGLATLVLTLLIYRKCGSGRLLALGQIFWVPLVYYLWKTLPATLGSAPYELWLLTVLIANSVALVFGVIDLIRLTLKL